MGWENPANRTPFFNERKNMPVFHIKAKVSQTVDRTIKLEVFANSEEDACLKADQALQEFPRAIQTESIYKMVSIKDEYYPPADVEYTEIREDRHFA
jgi:hypothetical protein